MSIKLGKTQQICMEKHLTNCKQSLACVTYAVSKHVHTSEIHKGFRALDTSILKLTIETASAKYILETNDA